MNTYDWYTNPVTGFQIYRMNGKGEVKVRDVPAHTAQKILAQEKQVKEMGWKIMRNGLDALSVFKIYANRRNEGDNIRRGDDISLYHVKDRKWVSAQTSCIQKSTCFGATRPPSSHSYDTCYKEVLELFKC